MPGKCLMIVNPISGLGFGRRSAPKLAARLREDGYEVEMIQTGGPGAARAAAQNANPDELSLILCVGGDGTVNEVVNGIGDRHIPLALLPCGTGNVLAKEYGLRRSVAKTCETISRGRTELLDVGVIGERRFVLFAGAGFDAAVAKLMLDRRTGRISMLSYVAPTIRALASYAFPEIRVTVDGRPAGTATTVLVTNVHSYGGPFGFVEQADPTDGLFDVCLLRGRGRWNLLRYLWGGFRHRILKYKDTACVRGTVVELDSESPAPLQADGDFVCHLPVKIELLHARLPVLVP